MRAGGVDARVERDVGALEGVEGERADDVGRADEAAGLGHREAADRGHELRAVDEGEALLGLQHERREAGRAQRLGGGQAPAADDALALADEREREVGEGREVAARADRALRGHDRVDAAVEHLDEPLEGLEAHAGEALARGRSRAGASARASRPRRAALRRRPRASGRG